MNCKFLFIIPKQFASGLCAMLFLMLYIPGANGQPGKTGYSDVARQRLLIRITGHYIHTVSQGQIDMDSAIRIPCRLYGLSALLPYNEGFSDGKPSVGTSLLDAGKVKEARALLARLQNEARLRLLIELGSYFVFRPGTVKADLDEASRYIKEALVISATKSAHWKIEGLTLQAFFLNQSGLIDECQKIFAEIIKLSEQIKNPKAQAVALLSAGRLRNYGDSSRLPDFEKALAIFQSLHEKEKEIETLSEINIEHFVFKRYNLVEQQTRRILELQKGINFHHNQYAYDVLSYLAILKGDITSALTYSNKSLESVTSGADAVFASLFYTRQADLYEHLNNPAEAMASYNKALENKSYETMLYWYKAFIRKARLLNHLDREDEALLLLGETGDQFPPVTTFDKMYFAIAIGEANLRIKKFDIAEAHYQIFLKLAENFPDEYIHGEFPDAFGKISALYLTIGKTDKARAILDRAKPFSFFQAGLDGKGLYYYDLFKIDSAEKRYVDAIKDLQLSNRFTDSAFSNDQRKKVAELLVKYEADKKDKDIKFLNSQNQFQLIRVKEANRTKNITLAAIALLLIVIGLLFNRYIIKQRNNRKLEINQKELDQKNIFLETLNAEQDKLLKEKEWLIKEVHHRVKNNLQMVTSLLNTQTAYLDNDAAVIAVKDSLRRMQAMSLIHQKLYKDENISTISMPEYIDELVRYLQDSFDTGNRIIFKMAIAPLDLDVSQAIPLGLIINESVVNAIKYAFLNEQEGMVNISLQPDGPDHLLLKISDNGIGLPPELHTIERNSLGFDLMQGLAKQLNGNFSIETNNGVNIRVRFTLLNKLYEH